MTTPQRLFLTSLLAVWTVLCLGTFGCGSTNDTTPSTNTSPPETPVSAKAGAESSMVATEKDPAEGPKVTSDAEWTQLLIGSWDGMQIKANSRRTATIMGVFILGQGGNLKFDMKVNSRQFIGYGSWKVANGQLMYTIENSNANREIPNGTSGAVKIREVTDNEFLYIDLTDDRTYSAKRVTGAPPGLPLKGKRGK